MTVTLPGLADALRAGTRPAHEQAESSSFVADLSAGRLPLPAYIALAAQNHAIYVALEQLGERWRADPVAGPFVRPELLRAPALERDLRALLGPGWSPAAQALVVPATRRYVAALHERAGADPLRFVAHHYVRYLGDLSGGQILRAAVRRVYGAAVDDAVNFWTFDDIPKIKPFRDDYRARLDAIPATAAEREVVVAEAIHAFELNGAVFADLAR